MCLTYLTDEHASCHGEPCAGREVGGDHYTQTSFREGKLVGVEDEEFIHHDDWRSLLTVGLTCGRSISTCSTRFTFNTLYEIPEIIKQQPRLFLKIILS